MTMMTAADIETVFNTQFQQTENTVLRGGASEPIYYPCSDDEPMAQIMYRLDYVSSALHEVAHWCLAGEQRRTLMDYGYWYEDDERNEQQQREFFQVEVKPQALEAIFSDAIHLSFDVSVDNVNAVNETELTLFRQRVLQQKERYQQELPERAQQFNVALLTAYASPYDVNAQRENRVRS
ncbi:MAG: elongation factor P hydroxylase [Pseudomonadota bacterium]